MLTGFDVLVREKAVRGQRKFFFKKGETKQDQARLGERPDMAVGRKVMSLALTDRLNGGWC